jgi:hypothetical protein
MGSSTITIFPLTIIFSTYCYLIIYIVCFDSSVTLKVTEFPFWAKPITFFCIMVTVLKVQHALKLWDLYVWQYKHWIMRLRHNTITPNQWLITGKFMHKNLEYKLPGLVITIVEIADGLFLGNDQKITDIYVTFWSTLAAICVPLTLFPISCYLSK